MLWVLIIKSCKTCYEYWWSGTNRAHFSRCWLSRGRFPEPPLQPSQWVNNCRTHFIMGRWAETVLMTLWTFIQSINQSIFKFLYRTIFTKVIQMGLVTDGHQKWYWKGEFWVVIGNCQMMKQCNLKRDWIPDMSCDARKAPIHYNSLAKRYSSVWPSADRSKRTGL